MSNRENIFNKVRAMLSKTVDNGCTEAEALLALSMAEKLMEEHEITVDDLKLDAETAVIGISDAKDPQNIRWKVCYFVSKFTATYAFGNKKYIKFVGLKSDVDFALWLTETLTAFIQAQLKSYMWSKGYQKLQGAQRNRVINSFVIGCCSRINTNLRDMIEARKVTTNSTALVVAKQALINDVVKDLNIDKADRRGRKHKICGDVFNDGLKAGDNASFGRPIKNSENLQLTYNK